MLKTFTKMLGGSNDSALKKLQGAVEEINELEPEFERLSDYDLRGLREEFAVRIDKGEELDDILPEAFAAVREAGRRTLEVCAFERLADSPADGVLPPLVAGPMTKPAEPRRLK